MVNQEKIKELIEQF